MTRTPISQRRIQTRRSTMMVALGAAHAMYYVARWFLLCGAAMNYAIESRMLSKRYFISYYNRGEIMRQMVYQSDTTSLSTIRMNIYAFTTLCDILESKGGLSNSKYMNVDEQVAMFLHTLAHNEKNRIIINRFQRSGETISRYFKLVLNAVCRVHKEFYKTPVPVPNDDLDERWKWFKGCLGALDGTYVTEPHIKSRMKTLKSNFSIVHDMLVGTNTSGFGFSWNAGTCSIDAEDEVWNEYIKTHKNAANFKGKPLAFYKNLCTIFGKDRATGSRAVDLGEEDDVEEETPVTPEADIDVPISGGAVSGNEVMGSASSKRKRSKSEDFNDTFKDCSNDLTERIEHSIGVLGDKIVASANQDIAGDILDDVITEIQNLPGITAQQRFRGMHIIGRNASKARIFLRSSEEDKVIYIQMLGDGPLD